MPRRDASGLIPLQQLADGFRCSVYQIGSLTSYFGIRTVKVSGRTHVPLREVVDMVASGRWANGGFFPTVEFRAFVREQLPPPVPSQWHKGEDDVWRISGRECLLTVSPMPVGHRDGDFSVVLQVFGYSDLFDEGRWERHKYPRFYFSLDVAKSETVAWLKRVGQYVE